MWWSPFEWTESPGPQVEPGQGEGLNRKPAQVFPEVGGAAGLLEGLLGEPMP